MRGLNQDSLASVSELYVAAKHGVPIASYSDDAEGHLTVVDGRVRMGRVTLRPHITLLPGADEERARTLVQETHRQCVIANSLHANVHIEPTFAVADTP